MPPEPIEHICDFVAKKQAFALCQRFEAGKFSCSSVFPPESGDDSFAGVLEALRQKR
jgi:hypothetical protein